MDMMMPDLDGVKVVRALKKAHPCQDMFIVVVTASLLYEVCRHESEQAGAAIFMTKPFSPSHLLEQINALLLAGQQNRDQRA